MRFTKMQGLGNDYLYVYGCVPENVAELSRRLSDRHFGVGSDGMIFITPSSVADFAMRIFNADGSEAAMCGNGIRCVGKYVYDRKHTQKTELSIETRSGVRRLKLRAEGGTVRRATVDMGTATVFGERVLDIGNGTVSCVSVSVGNPHAVIFVDDAEAARVAEIGPLVETHPRFPGGVNVEFVQILSDRSLRMRVWERGSGITMACGTGASASAAAAAQCGYCRYGEPIEVRLDGGILNVTVSKDHTLTMEGPAETVFEGEVEE